MSEIIGRYIIDPGELALKRLRGEVKDNEIAKEDVYNVNKLDLLVHFTPDQVERHFQRMADWELASIVRGLNWLSTQGDLDSINFSGVFEDTNWVTEANGGISPRKSKLSEILSLAKKELWRVEHKKKFKEAMKRKLR